MTTTYRIIATARRRVLTDQRARWLTFQVAAHGSEEFHAYYRRRRLGYEVVIERRVREIG